MKKFIKLLMPGEWAAAVFGVVFIVCQVFLDLKIPDYMAEITSLVATPGTSPMDILPAGGKMLLCTFGSVTAAVFLGYITAKIAAVLSKRLRSKLFERVEGFSAEEMNRFSVGSLITRSTNDITQIQMLVTMGFGLIIRAPVMAVLAILKISGKNIEWTLATGAALAIQLSVVAFLVIFVIPKFKKMQSLTDNINRVAGENLSGLRVVRAYNAEEYQTAKFENANTELTDTQLFTGRATSIMMPVMTLIMTGLPLVIYYIGANLFIAADINTKPVLFADMVVFSGYAMQIIMSFMMLVMIFFILPRAVVSAKRIVEVLDTEASLKSGEETAGVPEEEGKIVFENVGFKYPDAADYVLKDINFSIEKGEMIAFVGSTGSGKSTLINLIPRLFDVTEGAVYVNGVNVKNYATNALNNIIGYVSQKAVLFKGTVSYNVSYGDNGKGAYSDEDVIKAVETARGREFVEKMEGGYQGEISQNGNNISGGQKQRLSIARAICRKPDIYIFDDSFSALDYKTDRALRTALNNETEGATCLIVAQRIGTIMNADKIIVLDEGKVVGIGKHKDLMQTCGVYKQIAFSQLSEEELSV